MTGLLVQCQAITWTSDNSIVPIGIDSYDISIKILSRKYIWNYRLPCVLASMSFVVTIVSCRVSSLATSAPYCRRRRVTLRMPMRWRSRSLSPPRRSRTLPDFTSHTHPCHTLHCISTGHTTAPHLARTDALATMTPMQPTITTATAPLVATSLTTAPLVGTSVTTDLLGVTYWTIAHLLLEISTTAPQV